jgi:hypothetical protein
MRFFDNMRQSFGGQNHTEEEQNRLREDEEQRAIEPKVLLTDESLYENKGGAIFQKKLHMQTIKAAIKAGHTEIMVDDEPRNLAEVAREFIVANPKLAKSMEKAMKDLAIVERVANETEVASEEQSSQSGGDVAQEYINSQGDEGKKQREQARLEALLGGDIYISESNSAAEDAAFHAEDALSKEMNTRKKEMQWTGIGNIGKLVRGVVKYAWAQTWDRVKAVSKRREAANEMKEAGTSSLSLVTEGGKVRQTIKAVTDIQGYHEEWKRANSAAMLASELEKNPSADSPDTVEKANDEQSKQVMEDLLPSVIASLYNAKKSGTDYNVSLINAQKNIQTMLRKILNPKAIVYEGNLHSIADHIAGMAFNEKTKMNDAELSTFIKTNLAGRSVKLATLKNTSKTRILSDLDRGLLATGNKFKQPWLNDVASVGAAIGAVVTTRMSNKLGAVLGGATAATVRTQQQMKRQENYRKNALDRGNAMDEENKLDKRFKGKLLVEKLDSKGEKIAMGISELTTRAEKLVDALEAAKAESNPEMEAQITDQIARLYHQTQQRIAVGDSAKISLIQSEGNSNSLVRLGTLQAQVMLKDAVGKEVLDQKAAYGEEAAKEYRDAHNISKKEIAGLIAFETAKNAALGGAIGWISETAAVGLKEILEHTGLDDKLYDLYQGVMSNFAAARAHGGQGAHIAEALASGHTGAGAGGESQVFASGHPANTSIEGAGGTHTVVGEAGTATTPEHTTTGSHTETRVHTERQAWAAGDAEKKLASITTAPGARLIDPKIEGLLTGSKDELGLQIHGTQDRVVIDLHNIANSEHRKLEAFINLSGPSNGNVIAIPIVDGKLVITDPTLAHLIHGRHLQDLMIAEKTSDGGYNIISSIKGAGYNGSLDISTTETVQVPDTTTVPPTHDFVGPPKPETTPPTTSTGIPPLPGQATPPTGGIPPLPQTTDTGIPPLPTTPGVQPGATESPVPLVGQPVQPTTPGLWETIKNNPLPIFVPILPLQPYMETKPGESTIDTTQTAAQRLETLKNQTEAETDPVIGEEPPVTPTVEIPAQTPSAEETKKRQVLLAEKTDKIVLTIMGEPKEDDAGDAATREKIAAYVAEGIQDPEKAKAIELLGVSFEQHVRRALLSIDKTGSLLQDGDIQTDLLRSFLRGNIDPKHATDPKKQQDHFSKAIARVLQAHADKVAAITLQTATTGDELTPLQESVNDIIKTAKQTQETESTVQISANQVKKIFTIQEVKEFKGTPDSRLGILAAAQEYEAESQQTLKATDQTGGSSGSGDKGSETPQDKVVVTESNSEPQSEGDTGDGKDEGKPQEELSAALLDTLPLRMRNAIKGGSVSDKAMLEIYQTIVKNKEYNDAFQIVVAGEFNKITKALSQRFPHHKMMSEDAKALEALMRRGVLKVLYSSSGDPAKIIQNLELLATQKHFETGSSESQLLNQRTIKITGMYITALEKRENETPTASSPSVPTEEKKPEDATPQNDATLNPSTEPEKVQVQSAAADRVLPTVQTTDQQSKNGEEKTSQERLKDLKNKPQITDAAATEIPAVDPIKEDAPVPSEVKLEEPAPTKEPVPLSEKYSSKMVEQLTSPKTKDDETYIRMNGIIAEIISDPEAQKLEEKIVDDSVMGMKTAIKNMFKYATLSEADQARLLPDEATIKQMLNDEILEKLSMARINNPDKSTAALLIDLATDKKGGIMARINNIMADHLYTAVLNTDKQGKGLREWFVSEITNKKTELYERNQTIINTPKANREELSFKNIVESITTGQAGGRVQGYARGVLKDLLHQARQHK